MRPVPHSQHNPCPNELTTCGEGSMTKGGKRVVGRREREEKLSLGSEQGGHSHASLQTHNVLMRPVPHSQHNPCPTELTTCGEGSMTRERSAWWGDVNEKRNEV